MIKGKILAVDIDSDGRFVLTVAKEDAPLFKAAPENYEELRKVDVLVDWLNEGAISDDYLISSLRDLTENRKKALAKAEGK